MSGGFLDLTGLSRFLDHLKLLIAQSDWKKTDSEDMAFIKNKPTVSVENTTLVLTGWVETCTVTFMMNDGTQNVYTTQTVLSGKTASAPETNPTRASWTFERWSEKSSGASSFSFSTPITSDKTLYACWYPTPPSSPDTPDPPSPPDAPDAPTPA